ncbi:hypothetical protein [Segatella salivae]|uniref:hypothetical protein n=1 Tax=Segatella salivae TaxID=228604 RepID=UPI00241DFB9C|nr:hypothetical protein [Segatella salivae]
MQKRNLCMVATIQNRLTTAEENNLKNGLSQRKKTWNEYLLNQITRELKTLQPTI